MSSRDPQGGGSATVSSAPSISSLGLSPTPPMASSALPRICPACSGRYPADFRVCPRDATPLADAPEDADPLVGATLAESYEITRVLGEGGMGRVYEARHTRLPNKRFAIKMLHHELARQPEVVARFQREAEAMAAIEHANVVGVYDVNRAADGRPYIVQELLEGEELGKYLDRVGKLPPSTAVSVVRQVCRALAAAHARGIVHRDVKPENVILLGDLAAPRVKMVDFGISKLDEGSALTKTGVVMGTPAYMAPEQARGDRVDARADVYAAGAILYRALTGRKPYEGLDQIATLTAVLSEEPPRPRTLAPSIPEALELLIQRAMAREPADRLSRVEELDAGLAAFDQSGPSVSATGGDAGGHDKTMLAAGVATLLGASTVADASKNAKRARPLLVLASLVGLCLCLLVVGDGVLGAVRWIGDPTRGPSTGELVLSVVLSVVLLLAPLGLWVRFLARSVWSSTPRALETLIRTRAALGAGVVAYALLALAARLFELVVQRNPAAIAHPAWSLAAMLLCPLAAALAWFLPRKRS
ncbi:MAG: serine/threonine protein kinase [Polyangiaceae bacterium]|nr:serine/threonine protein kinase [Polyangiaceae bacterium]MCE7891661.1 serine/threonine protein kinase [Sorangiineae bacterium PRO1]MCL4750124.1 serine/threonine protein kinase [Myxococcales bacterium]MCL4750668.1 serine/threonine protein kinase [Myxococcales bacterium]